MALVIALWWARMLRRRPRTLSHCPRYYDYARPDQHGSADAARCQFSTGERLHGVISFRQESVQAIITVAAFRITPGNFASVAQQMTVQITGRRCCCITVQHRAADQFKLQ